MNNAYKLPWCMAWYRLKRAILRALERLLTRLAKIPCRKCGWPVGKRYSVFYPHQDGRRMYYCEGCYPRQVRP